MRRGVDDGRAVVDHSEPSLIPASHAHVKSREMGGITKEDDSEMDRASQTCRARRQNVQ